MPTTTPDPRLDLLKAVLKKLRYDKWCKYNLAETEEGEGVGLGHPKATRHCLMGWVYTLAPNPVAGERVEIILNNEATLDVVTFDHHSVFGVNDGLGLPKTRELVRRAIRRLEEREGG